MVTVLSVLEKPSVTNARIRYVQLVVNHSRQHYLIYCVDVDKFVAVAEAQHITTHASSTVNHGKSQLHKKHSVKADDVLGLNSHFACDLWYTLGYIHSAPADRCSEVLLTDGNEVGAP
jgi:hypothetical protein